MIKFHAIKRNTISSEIQNKSNILVSKQKINKGVLLNVSSFAYNTGTHIRKPLLHPKLDR